MDTTIFGVSMNRTAGHQRIVTLTLLLNFATVNKGRIPGKLAVSNSLVQFIHQTAFR